MINLILRANSFKNREAILSNGNSYSYNDLLKRSAQIASKILDGKEDLKESRIAFIVDPSFEYVAIQWGIWRAGGVAVPLCTKHPLSSLDYVIEDTQAYAIIYSQKYSSLIFPLFKKTIGINEASTKKVSNTDLPDINSSRNAMILYTSGTTGKPKGVVTTHKNIQAQIKMLVNAWGVDARGQNSECFTSAPCPWYYKCS